MSINFVISVIPAGAYGVSLLVDDLKQRESVVAAATVSRANDNKQ